MSKKQKIYLVAFAAAVLSLSFLSAMRVNAEGLGVGTNKALMVSYVFRIRDNHGRNLTNAIVAFAPTGFNHLVRRSNANLDALARVTMPCSWTNNGVIIVYADTYEPSVVFLGVLGSGVTNEVVLKGAVRSSVGGRP